LKTIWKYELQITDMQTVMMPKGAEIISVDNQFSDVCMWAIVDTTCKPKGRIIEIVGTGNPMIDDDRVNRWFIGTVIRRPYDGFVWHVFERT